MNPVSCPSPARFTGMSGTRAGHGAIRFGEDPAKASPAEEASAKDAPKQGALGSLVDEVKRFFREILDGIFGRFRHVLAATGSAISVLGDSFSWTRALSEAHPDSTFEDKARVIGSLAHAAFHENLTQRKTDGDGPVRDRLLYDLYAHVLREFPGLLKNTADQPKIGEVSLLSRLIHAHPDYDNAQANAIGDRVRDHQDRINALEAEALAGFAKALIAGDTAKMDDLLKPETGEN